MMPLRKLTLLAFLPLGCASAAPGPIDPAVITPTPQVAEIPAVEAPIPAPVAPSATAVIAAQGPLDSEAPRPAASSRPSGDGLFHTIEGIPPGAAIARAGRSSGKPPVVRLRPPVVGESGGELLSIIVRRNSRLFRVCYEDGLRTAPTLTGMVSVQFVLERDGSVSGASVSPATTLPDAAVVACVVGAFASLAFPVPRSGPVNVTYPLEFVVAKP